jgi:hypothetical protein
VSLLSIVFTDVVGSSATKCDLSLGRDNRERDRTYLEFSADRPESEGDGRAKLILERRIA